MEITESSSQLLQFSYGVFTGSLLFYFLLNVNVIGFIITNYLLEKVDLEKKLPWISKYLNRFKKIALFYICLALLFCLILLFLFILYSLIIIAHLQYSV